MQPRLGENSHRLEAGSHLSHVGAEIFQPGECVRTQINCRLDRDLKVAFNHRLQIGIGKINIQRGGRPLLQTFQPTLDRVKQLENRGLFHHRTFLP